MSRSDEQRLADIRQAAAELADIVALGRDHFLGNRVFRRGAERLLEIIGEASNLLSDGFKAERADIAWKDIAGLRVRLAHHYHRVDPQQVWQIAAHDVPALIASLADDRQGGLAT